MTEPTSEAIIKTLKSELFYLHPTKSKSVVFFYNLLKGLGEFNTLGLPDDNSPISRTTKNPAYKKLWNIGYKNNEGNLVLRGINRVTQKYINEESIGLDIGMARYLGWHCNEWCSETEYNFLALQAVNGVINSQVEILDSRIGFDLLKNHERKSLEHLTCLWRTASIRSDIPKDFNIDFNFSKKNHIRLRDLIKKDFILKRPLVYKSSNGHQGIHFSPYQVRGIEGFSQKEFQDFRSWVIEKFYKNSFIKKHKWEEGDIIIIDQIYSLIRRTKSNGDLYFNDKELSNRHLNRAEIRVI